MSKESPDLASARRFKALLNRIGIKQAQLARDIETPPNTISRWATGRQTPGPIVWAYLELRANVAELEPRSRRK